jgi:DNA polymerase (family 10)
VDNRAVADVLEEMVMLMDLKGENAFRTRAYANAARRIETMEETIEDLAEKGELDSVKGIGKGLAAGISELLETGKMGSLEKLRESVPEGLIEMMDVPGLGAKKVRSLYAEMQISDIDALAKACEAGDVEKLSGFGKKTAEKVLQGIAFLQEHRGRFLADTALNEAENIRSFLADQQGVIRVEVTGSIRRRCETTKDVDVVASTDDPAALGEAFVGYGEVREVTGQGETKVSVILKSGMSADLRMVKDEVFPFTLHHFTGSKEHNTQMRARAKTRGLRMNEYGLSGDSGDIACKDEEEIFGALGLSFVPPELREGLGEIEKAESGEFEPLVTEADLKGTLHVHTTHSDGRASVEAMARAAIALGHTYIAICDHSRAAAYAGGLTEERVRAQWEEIDQVGGQLDGIHILKGIEVDIMSEGDLDFEDPFLAEFDLVVASVHSRFGMTEEEATERMVKAVRNPNVHILGHPTGRLLLSRDGYPLDLRAVLDAAAETDTSVEVNANPRRLDIDWRHLAYAKAQGVMISINTDAHSIAGLEQMNYGVGIARKGGLAVSDVLNALPIDGFLTQINKQK